MLDPVNSWKTINAAALDNLAAWVPALNLPNTKKFGALYRTVAGFRPSRRAGLPDAKRGRALTISPNGICDHADGNKGYSPIDLVAACFGMEPGEAKDWLADALGGTVAVMERPVPAVDHTALIRNSRNSPAQSGAVERRWARCVPITGTLAERYLGGRGLSYEGDALRYCASHNALAALVTDPTSGAVLTIQFTYLDSEGRKLRRLFMRDYSSAGVVRLSPDEDVSQGLAIAEGIETALAVPFRPVWACLVANNMASFPVLPGIGGLTIFADNDRSGTGQRVANQCAERWHAAGREVTINIIDQMGADFADVLAEAA